MLAQESFLAASDQAHRVLQFRSHAEHLGEVLPQEYRHRDIAAGTPDRAESVAHNTGDRVVTADVNASIMEQEEIGDIPKARSGRVVIGDDGFVTLIAAGHDQGLEWSPLEKQSVQRRVGKKRPQQTIARRHGRSDGQGLGSRLKAAVEEHNGALHTLQKQRFIRIHPAVAVDGVQVGKHDGKGFFFSNLAAAQPGHGIFPRGRHRQVKSAQSFDGDNRSLSELSDRFPDGIIPFRDHPAACRFQPDLRPAFPTRIGLRMETAVARVLVLLTARVTHGEIHHGGFVAVVGNISDDRVARPAIRAIDKRVAIATVARVQKLPQTVFAGADIG